MSDHPLDDVQQRAWLNYMRVYHRLEYETNRHLQTDCGFSLGDYTVMNALSRAPGRRMQLTGLANVIGWERSRLSHHLLRMTQRGLVERTSSDVDGRGTDAVLSPLGWARLQDAAPIHAAWKRRAFFGDIGAARTGALADVLDAIYGNVLREGTLSAPDEPQS